MAAPTNYKPTDNVRSRPLDDKVLNHSANTRFKHANGRSISRQFFPEASTAATSSLMQHVSHQTPQLAGSSSKICEAKKVEELQQQLLTQTKLVEQLRMELHLLVSTMQHVHHPAWDYPARVKEINCSVGEAYLALYRLDNKYCIEMTYGMIPFTGFGEISDFSLEYSGGLKEGLFHGRGKLMLKNTKEKISGHFEGGILTKGTIHFANGSFYQGEMKDLKMHGEGVLVRQDWKYSGSFKNGQYHGFGTLFCKKRTVYEGRWKNGQKQGMGFATMEDGSTYDGNFHAGKRHGEGIFTDANGVYSVQYKEGVEVSRGPYESD